jgi:dephospho-CoA kinase
VKQVGITGGIGTGKSTVCRLFSLLGIPVYDADQRAKRLYETDETLQQEVKSLFGEDLFVDGKLQRTLLAARVFGKPEKLHKLNNLVHPAVARDYQIWKTKQSDAPYVLREAALLFEAGADRGLDAVLVVTAPLELRIERVKARDPQRKETEIRAIIDRQWPEEKKIALASHVIHNDGLHALIPQVLTVHQELIN